MRRWLVPFWVLGLLLALPAARRRLRDRRGQHRGRRAPRTPRRRVAGSHDLLSPGRRRPPGEREHPARVPGRPDEPGQPSWCRPGGPGRATHHGRRAPGRRWPRRCACARATWRVPGDLLVRALPTLVGTRRAGDGRPRGARHPAGASRAKPTVRPRSPRRRAPSPCRPSRRRAPEIPAAAPSAPVAARPRGARPRRRGPSRIRPRPPCRARRPGPRPASSFASAPTRRTRGWSSRRTRRSSPGWSRPRAAG